MTAAETTSQSKAQHDSGSPQLDRVEAYFGRNAAEWQELYARPRRVNDVVLANRRRLGVAKISARVAPGAPILDAGCGAGLVALDLAERGYFVHGIDIAEGMLALSERRFEAAGIARDRYRFSRENVARSELPGEGFAGIVALGFIEYQDDELAALRQLNRLLAPRGTLVVSGPSEIKLANYFGIPDYARERLSHFGLVTRRDRAPRLGLHRYSFARFRTLLEATGFEVEECVGHGFVEFQGLSQRLSYEQELRLHQTLSWAAEFLPLQRFGNDLMAVARKR